MKFRRLLVAVPVLALAVPVIAAARVPSPATKLIVPGKSIGGISIGMNYKAAEKLWGTPSSCAKPVLAAGGGCSYTGPTNTSKYGTASFNWSQGKVIEVTIQANESRSQKYTLTGPLTKFKTATGIGLLSSRAAVRRAYPRFKVNGTFGYFATGPGKHVTNLATQKNVVTSISVNNGEIG
jgi:hypothetical protein